jgi:dipeptide/tripeptide permease
VVCQCNAPPTEASQHNAQTKNMNEYGWIVAVTCVVEFLVSFTANILNVSSLSPIIPAEFKGVYDAADYKKSQARRFSSRCFFVFFYCLFFLFIL